ncbi:MAG: hypothetical protein EPO11_09055 [Gammaproteobacteria bacterium]|nr:MAG: hypothetical protein EPO11_09055 [Gammaproteobacteria bacterium]
MKQAWINSRIAVLMGCFIALFYPLITQAAGNSIVTVDVGGVGQYTSIALDAQGNPVVSYYDAAKTTLKVVHCFEKNCALFNAITKPDPAGQAGKYTSLMLDSNGNPVVSYYDQTNSNLKVIHCGNSSCLSGNTMTSPDIIGNVGQYTSLTLDSKGWPVVSYYDVTKGVLKMLHCGNAACTSGNNIATPDIMSSNGVQSSIKLNALGNPVIAYFDFTQSALKILRCGNAQCTAGNSITTPDSGGDVGRYPSLAFDSNGNPVVSYLDLTNGKLKILHCGNATCSSGNTIVTPDMSQTVGYYSSLRLDAAGNPVVSYYDSANGDLKVLHCGNATCSTGNTITVPDTVGTVGQYTSLILDAMGNPVVSYYDASKGALKVLHCATPTCSLNTTVVSDGSNHVGQYSSLKLDANGNPVVSYWDEANGDLKLLHCGNASCTSGNSIKSPDTTGNTGWDTSLALDTNGNPVVSYYDFTASKMTLMHCTDPTCSGAKSITKPDVLSKRHTSLALDATGHPVIASAGQADQGLRIVHCGDANCSANNTTTSPDFPAFPFQSDIRGVSLALDANGNPVVSYYRADQQQLKILHCTDPACAAQNNSIATPDPNAKAPSHRSTSLTLDASGNPVVAYHDSANNVLKILHCGNPNCTAGNTIMSPVVNAGIELDPSIKLDANGNPVVSYAANTGLQILHCGNATCSAGNTIAAADSAGNTGWDSSLALDASGNPVVSYYNATGMNLRVLHCGTSTCQ